MSDIEAVITAETIAHKFREPRSMIDLDRVRQYLYELLDKVEDEEMTLLLDTGVLT